MFFLFGSICFEPCSKVQGQCPWIIFTDIVHRLFPWILSTVSLIHWKLSTVFIPILQPDFVSGFHPLIPWTLSTDSMDFLQTGWVLLTVHLAALFSSPEPKAHMWAYSIPMLRRPSGVRPASVVHNFKDLLWNRLANQSQTSCGASLGTGNYLNFTYIYVDKFQKKGLTVMFFFNCRHSSLVSICTVPHESSVFETEHFYTYRTLKWIQSFSYRNKFPISHYNAVTRMDDIECRNQDPRKDYILLADSPSTPVVNRSGEHYWSLRRHGTVWSASDRYTNAFIDHVQSVQKYYKIRSEILYILLVLLVSIVVSIPACHAGDRGSIPWRGALFFIFLTSFLIRI